MKIVVILTLILLSACGHHDGRTAIGDAPKVSKFPFPTGLFELTNDVGTLTISTASAKAFAFMINTSSQAIDTCEYSGDAVVTGNKASFKNGKCEINFTSNGPEGILVESTCPEACGKTASMDGLYADFGDTCEAVNIQRARDYFNKQIEKKEYVDAINEFSPLISKCEGPMNRFRPDRARDRNALASAAHKAGDHKRCLKFIGQIDDSQDLNPTAYSSFWPKDDLEELTRIKSEVEATRKLCQK